MQNVHHLLQKADEAVYASELAEVHAEAIDWIFAILDDESFLILPIGLAVYKRAGLQTSGSTIGTVATTEQSARSGRNSANTTALTNLKTTLAAERAKQEAAADRLYRNSEQGGWNSYLTGVQSANTAYLTSQKTAENTYKTAADAADTAYRPAAVTAYTNFSKNANTLNDLFYDAVPQPKALHSTLQTSLARINSIVRLAEYPLTYLHKWMLRPLYWYTRQRQTLPLVLLKTGYDQDEKGLYGCVTLPSNPKEPE